MSQEHAGHETLGESVEVQQTFNFLVISWSYIQMLRRVPPQMPKPPHQPRRKCKSITNLYMTRIELYVVYDIMHYSASRQEVESKRRANSLHRSTHPLTSKLLPLKIGEPRCIYVSGIGQPRFANDGLSFSSAKASALTVGVMSPLMDDGMLPVVSW